MIKEFLLSTPGSALMGIGLTLIIIIGTETHVRRRAGDRWR